MTRHYDQIVTIDPSTVDFVGNRLWWSVALFLSPIAGAIARQPVVAILASAALVRAVRHRPPVVAGSG